MWGVKSSVACSGLYPSEPMSDGHLTAWNLFVELRKETLESQKLRTYAVGFKISFVTTGIALITSNPDKDKILPLLLVIPAFAAMFFDLLICSYSFSIKRIGYYCRKHLEKAIQESAGLPADFLSWEQFLLRPKMSRKLPCVANLGLTVLALIPAVLALLIPIRPLLSWPLLAILAVLFIYDIRAHLLPQQFQEKGKVDGSGARQAFEAFEQFSEKAANQPTEKTT